MRLKCDVQPKAPHKSGDVTRVSACPSSGAENFGAKRSTFTPDHFPPPTRSTIGGQGARQCSVNREKNMRGTIIKFYRSARGAGGRAGGGSARVGVAAPRAPGGAVPSLAARLADGDLPPPSASP